jgi:hypothetical protein
MVFQMAETLSDRGKRLEQKQETRTRFTDENSGTIKKREKAEPNDRQLRESGWVLSASGGM